MTRTCTSLRNDPRSKAPESPSAGTSGSTPTSATTVPTAPTATPASPVSSTQPRPSTSCPTDRAGATRASPPRTAPVHPRRAAQRHIRHRNLLSGDSSTGSGSYMRGRTPPFFFHWTPEALAAGAATQKRALTHKSVSRGRKRNRTGAPRCPPTPGDRAGDRGHVSPTQLASYGARTATHPPTTTPDSAGVDSPPAAD